MPKSAIFFGPPGTGKTTAARILAAASSYPVVYLNAVDASIKDIRAAKEKNPDGVLVYLDEIQFFNRKQQQSLLPYVEDGSMTLIAATTENPWHSCYDALLSRVRVREFKRPKASEIKDRLREILDAEDASDLASDEVLQKVSEVAAGDVRRAISMLEDATKTAKKEQTPITAAILEATLPNVNLAGFDTSSDVHYSLLAAFQKSIRGSDPDAAVFYLSRLLMGEDLISPSRRLLVIASEDVGLADPNAITHTLSCVQAAERLGFPEAWKPLTQATIYLALAPKSASIEAAYGSARKDIEDGLGATVPSHIAKGCPKDYVWPHERPWHWANQEYLPEDLRDRTYYKPDSNSPLQNQPFEYWASVRASLMNTPEAQTYHPRR